MNMDMDGHGQLTTAFESEKSYMAILYKTWRQLMRSELQKGGESINIIE